MIKKVKFWIDCVAATVFIYAFMWIGFQFLSIFDFLDPIGDALKGYEMTDQVFSNPQWRSIPPPEEEIVIVNFSDIPRSAIAEQINIINSFGPKVIGLDGFFPDLKPDTLGDMMLAEALANSPNLIMYSKLLENDDTDFVWNDVEYSHPFFTQNHETASVNFPIENVGGEQWQFKTCRSFFPRELLRNPETGKIDSVLAFGVALAQKIDPEKTERFLSRNLDEELINYRGNVIDYGRTKHGNRFYALDWYQVLDTASYTADLLADKIVLIGFLGKDFEDHISVEDKYFTPLNSQYTGRANPDMYGVVIHANIISMILNEDYLDQMKESTAWILSILVCFLNVVAFSMIYYKLPKWYDGLTKLIQLTEALVFTFIIIAVFHWFNFKLNLTYTIIVVLLAGDSLEVYYGVIVNTYEKIGQKLFTNRKLEV